MDHLLVSWRFPVYIEPSALLLLIITTYRNTFFPFFLLTAFLLIDYDWRPTDRPTDQPTNRPTDRQTDSTETSYLRVTSYTTTYGIPRGDDGKLFRLEV